MISIKNKVFHLSTRRTSYVFALSDDGIIEHLYYGHRITAPEDSINALKRPIADASPFDLYLGNEEDGIQPSKRIGIISTEGFGDFRVPEFSISYSEKNLRALDLRYEGHKVHNGIKKMDSSLPQTYGEGAKTLEIVFKDNVAKISIKVFFTTFEDSDVISRRAVIENEGSQSITIKACYSLQLDLPFSDLDLTTLDYVHGKGLVQNTRAISYGRVVNESRRGINSIDHNSAILLERRNSKDAFAFNLLYTGSHSTSIEVDSYSRTRVLCGINPEQFEKKLSKGQAFETPEAIMLFCDEGRDAISKQIGNFIEDHIIRGEWKNRLRPIMFSTDYLGYAYNERELYRLLRHASALGFEGFLLSDGWFGARNSDNTSLGDWTANPQKFSHGLRDFSNEVHSKGMLFGLHIQPELVSRKSNLYEKCPEWALIDEERLDNAGKKEQLILDLTRPDVHKYISDILKFIVRTYNVDYLKWDMNHQIGEIFTTLKTSPDNGEYLYQYILSLYSILKELLNENPHLLIDMGSRLDLGILSFANQVTVSSSDVLSCSLFYPHSALSSFNSCLSAMLLGIQNYSVNIDKNPESFKNALEFYKQNRKLFQYGEVEVKDNLLTLSNPERNRIIAIVFDKATKKDTMYQPLTISCVKDDALYIMVEIMPQGGFNENEAYKLSGDMLKGPGIQLKTHNSDSSTRVFTIKEIIK